MNYNEIYKAYKAGKRLPASQVPKEAYFQKKILDYLKTLKGCKAWKAHQESYYCCSGLVDINCVYKGKYYGFEVKRPWYGRLSPLQRITIDEIRAAGAYAGTVIFVEDVKAVLEGSE